MHGLKKVKKLTCRIICSNGVMIGARGLMGEHGFAALVDDGHESVLFDTGQSGNVLVNNLKTMRIKGIESIVLSHGHYDHSGGLMEYLARYPGRCPIYSQASAFNRRFKKIDNKLREIGIPFMREGLEEAGAEIHESDGPQMVADWLVTTGVIGRANAFEAPETEFLVESEGKLTADQFLDDLAIIAELDGKGLVIVTGCAHSGIINTVNHAKELVEEEKIYAIIGGYHLEGASEAKITKTIDALVRLDPSFIVPAHCTGKDATFAIKNAFGKRVIDGDVGLKITL